MTNSNGTLTEDGLFRLIHEISLHETSMTKAFTLCALRELQERRKAGDICDLFLRAKQLMYQSGGAPIENSLNPIDAWLYDAEHAAKQPVTIGLRSLCPQCNKTRNADCECYGKSGGYNG